MHTQLNSIVEYQLPIGEQLIPLNLLLNKKISLHYTGVIHCIHCQRKTKKSFSQGYCYPCFKKLAQCDLCIMSPEKCHYFAGTCREPEWADKHCMQDHFVYLANSSGLKVGITRGNQIPTRWMDQGAIQALPIFRVSNRLQSGLLEVLFKHYVADKTNWRKMLKGEVDTIDLPAERDSLLDKIQSELTQLQQRFGIQSITAINDADVVDISYPVVEHPKKIISLNFDKQAEIEGILKGIKGQYLLLDTGVINIRKFSAYHVAFRA
ncbi:DUF2797 domain-containing protein [bacterium AH-315-K03]|nr:DUF2797 domain-containing protein [bacterium AH-315-K03]